MYAGLWRHARSLTVGAVCVALSVAGHLSAVAAHRTWRTRRWRPSASPS